MRADLETLKDKSVKELEEVFYEHVGSCDDCNYDREGCPCEYADPEDLGDHDDPKNHQCNCSHGWGGRIRQLTREAGEREARRPDGGEAGRAQEAVQRSMRATLIAHTRLVERNEIGDLESDEWLSKNTPYDPDFLGEFGGRACYEAWERKNPATATNEGYLAHIIDVGHFSVLEHASASIYLTGVSRALTHEMTRHRHLSPSQRSQRYVDESSSQYVIPKALRDRSDDPAIAELLSRVDVHHEYSLALYDDIYQGLRFREVPVKRAREAARGVLFGSTHTGILVSGNFRAWRDFLGKRWHVDADEEIKECAGLILAELRKIAPNSFQDIPEVPYGSTNDVA